MNKRTNLIIRWIARILAALMAAFIAFMFVGNAVTDGIGPLMNLTIREAVMMIAFLVVFLGLILGWAREKVGGWLTVGGMILFFILDFAFSGTFPRGVFFPLMALPGLMFLLTGYSQNPSE